MSDRSRRDSSVYKGDSPLKQYRFSVHWSEEDDEYVGTCDGFKSLSHLSGNPCGALYGIMDLILDVVTEMKT